jgi:aryl-alcohol dehydrogenase-like predicted oxidoreductase
LGIGITAYGVLSRGLISGHATSDTSAPGDFRGHSPRFQGENLTKNLELAERLRAAAAEMGLTPAQAAIAWVAAKGTDIIPLVGARRRDRLAEALGALKAPLTPAQVATLEAAVPKDAAAGNRYPDIQMAMLDSEKR